MIYMEENGSSDTEKNVFGDELRSCSEDPMTGYQRDGQCSEVDGDRGLHQICAVMTDEFLRYSKKRGNDLSTPNPAFNFPGLEAGDCWCVCVPRWIEALEDDKAPPVILEATSQAVLEHVPLKILKEHAAESN